MPTTWHPRTNFDKRSWLLGNGEVVQEPDLEESPSGRKLRIAGTNLSAYSKDLDELVTIGVRNLAAQKQTLVWMPLTRLQGTINSNLGYDPSARRAAKLHLLSKQDRTRSATTIWWRFKHPTLPIEAVLSLTLSDTSGADASPQDIEAVLISPRTDCYQGDEVVARVLRERQQDFSSFGVALDYDHRNRLHEFVRDNPPSWDTSVLGIQRHATERSAVHDLLRRARTVAELDSIQVPDLRVPTEPGWLDLELFDTNMNNELVADLEDYLDGAPSVAEALRLYEELRKTLRGVGVSLGPIAENQLQQALSSGSDRVLEVSVGMLAEENHGADTAHTLHMNLVSGTFIVTCRYRTDQDQIAHAWDEALTVAQLSGQEDTLLAYAREYVRRQDRSRVKRIVEERRNTA